jgi:hypothetical protein
VNPSADGWIAELEALVAAENEAGALAHMRKWVPEYQPGGERKPAQQGRSSTVTSGGFVGHVA